MLACPGHPPPGGQGLLFQPPSERPHARAGGQARRAVTTLLPYPCPMKLVTFQTGWGEDRTGALSPDGNIVDLNSACALYLRDSEGEAAYLRLAGALVPPSMRELFAGGDTGLEAARKAFDHAL